jgi:AraC-like DNA-binding protein/mannose-6-phosphate isomerase-like protein (cupin superfamily)
MNTGRTDSMIRRDSSFTEVDAIERDNIDSEFHYFDVDDRLVADILSADNFPHRHDYEEVIWIRCGSAEHLLDGEQVVASANTLLIVPKGHVHRLMPSAGLEGGVVRFKDEFLPALPVTVFSQFGGLSQLSLSEEDRSVVEGLFSLIRSESRHITSHRRATVSFLVQALASKAEEIKLRPLEADDGGTVKERQHLWEGFNDAVEEHLRTEHDVAFYAKVLGITPRKLNEVVKLFTGQNVARAIDERLVLEAKRLILFSDMNIKEIAFGLGFAEHSYFSKVFKKITGSTPAAFRKKL